MRTASRVKRSSRSWSSSASSTKDVMVIPKIRNLGFPFVGKAIQRWTVDTANPQGTGTPSPHRTQTSGVSLPIKVCGQNTGRQVAVPLVRFSLPCYYLKRQSFKSDSGSDSGAVPCPRAKRRKEGEAKKREEDQRAKREEEKKEAEHKEEKKKKEEDEEEKERNKVVDALSRPDPSGQG